MEFFDPTSNFNGKSLILWGGGKKLTEFINDYVETGLIPRPIGICDTTRPLGEQECGIKSISMDQLRKMHPKETAIIITAGLLELQGAIVRNELYYFQITHRLAIETHFELIKKIRVFANNLHLFSDDRSKQIYTSRLQSLLQSQLIDVSLYSYPPYFGNEIFGQLSPGERIFFAGAFNGKHVENMLESCPKVEIIACEPSPFWSKYLAEQFKKSENVKINNTLLWDSANEMYFDDDLQNGGLDAQILKSPKEGSTKIPTDTIDNLSQGKKIDYIFLDVEGAEQKVLQGARQTISQFVPKMGICIYHTFDDYIEIPRILGEEYGDKYQFYVRQHSVINRIETVLYAKPVV